MDNWIFGGRGKVGTRGGVMGGGIIDIVVAKMDDAA